MRDVPDSPLRTSIGWRRQLLLLAGLWIVLAIARFYPLSQMNYSGLIVVVVLLGWLAYQFLAPLRLVRRRALLDHLTTADSALRRWLWNSALSKIFWSVQALVTGLLVLLFTARMTGPEWWVMFAGALLYPWLLPWAARFVERQVKPEYSLTLQVRAAYWMILLPVIVAVMAVQWIWGDVADTRSLPLLGVVSQAFRTSMDTAAVPFTGWLLGLSAALDQGVWHLMQLASSAPEASAGLKAAAWLVFLLINALKVAMLWAVLSGVAHLLLVTAAGKSGGALLGDSSFARSFNISMLGLFAGYLALTQINVGSLLVPVRERVVSPLAQLDPCRSRATTEQQQILVASQQALTRQQQALVSRMEESIDQRLDTVFTLAEAGVDSFLDWNFSLRGQYTQLLFMGTSAIGEQSFAEYISGRMDDFVAESAAPALAGMYTQLQEEFEQDAQTLYLTQAAQLENMISEASCLELPAPQIALAEFANKSAVGAGSGAGVLAARAGMRVGSRAVGRSAGSRVLAGTFARFSSRLGASSVAGATGTFCGPFVVVCAPVLAAGAWLATDLAINEVDEAWNRERMRQEMLDVLAEEKLQWKQNLTDQYGIMLAQVAADLKAYQMQRFNIQRDGL